VSTTVFFAVTGDDWSRAHVLEALTASTWISVAGLVIAAGASTLLPGRAAVRAHLDAVHAAEEHDDAVAF